MTVGLSACYLGNPNGPKVGDVGDSITNMSAWAIQSALNSDYAYQVNGQNGYTMAEQLPEIRAIDNDQQGAPADWIVELGTNDALQGNPNWQADFTNEIQAVSEAKCVVLLTVSPVISAFSGSPVGDDLNAAIEAQAQADPKYHVLDWGNIAFQDRTWLLSDGVHPTTSGQQELASLELQALQRDC